MNEPVIRKRFKRSHALRWALAGMILATIIAMAAIFVGYRRLPTDPKSAVQALKNSQADIALKEVRHTATRDGKDEWTLTAKAAHVMEDKKITVIESPSVVFFLSDGGKVLLTARQGILKSDSSDIEAVGDVRVKSREYILKTERLEYDHAQRVIYAKEPVVIEGLRVSLAAESMFYDLSTQTTTLQGNVESVIHEKIVL